MFRSFQSWKSIRGIYAFILNLLGKQDGEVSKAVHTPHFSNPIPLRLANIFCIYESELNYRCKYPCLYFNFCMYLSIQVQRNKIQLLPSSYAKYVFSTHMISFTHGSVIDVKRISFFQNCRKPMLVIHVTFFSLNHKHNYSPVQFYSPLNTT